MFEEFLGPAPGWAESPWLGPLGIILGIASLTLSFLLWFFTPPAVRLQRRVDSVHAKDRKWLRDVLGGATPFEGYIAAVGAFNMRLDGWFGGRWSGQAFRRCLYLAFIYPIALAFLGIAIGAGNTEGLLFSLITIGGIGVGAVTGRALKPRLNRLHDHSAFWLSRRLFGQGSTPPVIITILTGGVVGAIFGAFAFFAVALFAGTVAAAVARAGFVVVVGVGAGAGAGLVAIAIAAAVVFAVVFDGAVAAVFAGAVTGAVAAAIFFAAVFADGDAGAAVIGASAGKGIGAFSGAFAFAYFLMLPAFNAVLDWLSWGVTRYFLGEAEKASSTGWGMALLVLELLADSLIAALLLVMLAMLFAAGAELTNQLFNLTGGYRLPWEEAASAFLTDPWGTGLFVTGMLITTLIPTFLHLVAGVAGTFFAWSPKAKALAKTVPYSPALKDNQRSMSEIDRELIVRKLRQMRWWIVPASVLVLLIFAGFYGLFSLTGETFLVFLFHAAKCGGALAGNGVCALL